MELWDFALCNGIFINRSYDELNLSQPELFAAFTRLSSSWGEIIETNTFGANSFRLARHSWG